MKFFGERQLRALLAQAGAASIHRRRPRWSAL